MRVSIVVLAGMAVAAGSGVASADDVKVQDLPPAVRATVEKEAQGAVLEDVERESKNGRVYYEVEIERGNVEWKLHIDEAGNVIKRKRES